MAMGKRKRRQESLFITAESLPKTKVKLIEDAGSYSLVESETGVQAYISTDAVREGQ